MAWFLITAAVVVAVLLLILFLNRFYRKATREVALIRTGAGGQLVVMDGGCLALPFLHQVSEVNMKTMRIEAARSGPKALITGDRLRVDAEVEFYVRVLPTRDGVATAAQALGGKAFRSQDLADLIEGRLVDAIQAVAARQTMDELHENRGRYVKEVRETVAENLGQSGLMIESVALRRFDQTPFASLEENNAFNAVGMRRLAEVVASNKKQRAAIEADAEVAVRQSQLDAMKRVLIIEREQEEAQIAQKREIEMLKAETSADVAERKAESDRRSEHARIGREREVRAFEIARDREMREMEMSASLQTELVRHDNAIQLARKRGEEAAAEAEAEHARTAVVLAQEAVQTDKDKAVAERARMIAQMRAEEAADVDTVRTRSESETTREQAKAEADALALRAQAKRTSMIADAEGKAALIAAENGWSEPIIRMKLDMHRLDKLPEVLGQMMKPVEKIESIRINQISGLGVGGAGGGGGSSGERPLVNQAVDSILGMALQLPALQKLGEEIGLNLGEGIKGVGEAPRATPDPAAKPTSKS